MFIFNKLKNKEMPEALSLRKRINELTEENAVLRKRVQELTQKKNCDNIVLCQNCVNGIRQRSAVHLRTGEIITGHVACKLNQQDICTSFSPANED